MDSLLAAFRRSRGVELVKVWGDASRRAHVAVIDFLSRQYVFLVAALVVLGAGVFVLARGASARRRLSFFQLSLTVAVWTVLQGSLLQAGPAAGRVGGAGDLFVFVGLLVATTAYQFVSHGLEFGRKPAGRRVRQLAVILLWSVTAAVGVLLATGEFTLVREVRPTDGGAAVVLTWYAAVVVALMWGTLVDGVVRVLQASARSPAEERSFRAHWVAGALVAFLFVPFALHTPLLGAGGIPAAGVATLAGSAVMATLALLDPIEREAAPPHVGAMLLALRGPALAVDRQGTIDAANESFLEAFEHGRRELVGRALEEIVEDSSGSHIPLASLSLEVREEGRDVRIRSGDGRPIRARAVALQLGHLEGEALPTVFLLHTQSQEREAGSRTGPVDRWLRDVFRPEVPALAICDLEDGRFAAANDQFVQLTGYSVEDVLGRTVQELELASNPYRWSTFFDRVRKGEPAERAEMELQRGGGDEKFVEFFGFAYIDDDDRHRALVLGRDLTALREAEKRLRGQVLYDPLTGLPNRVLFEEQLDHALDRAQRHHQRVGILLIDVNGLQEVNEEYGEDAGDEVLTNVAWRLYECFRQMDILCRRGDDEFMVMLEDLDDARGAATAADRFRGYMEEPFQLQGGREASLTATIGIAVSVPGQTEGEDLIEWADVALFRAKRRGESPIRVYDPERDAGDMERLNKADRLRRAIDHGELALRYQPLVDLVGERIIGAEALVRWPQPSGEVLTPAEFIPLAEETGLIIPLSDWVFETAIEQTRTWQRVDPEFEMSINIAAQHFREPSLAATWERLLNSFPVRPETIQLEITESFALRDDQAIHRLRDLGLRVAVDDFGTGYSSLAYLRELDVDVVKIDRAFVISVAEDPRDQAIVRAVLLMADAFGLTVTAEGIETENQLRWLTDAGCHIGQGYYFAHPMMPGDFEQLMRQGLGSRAAALLPPEYR